MHRFGDVLNLLEPKIIESEVDFGPYIFVDRPRDDNRARFR